jgi:enoyl-[acyl-carrier protein] reductase I
MFAFQQRHSPLGRGVPLEDLGGAGRYLLSELSGGVTGAIHFVDSGYNIIHAAAGRAAQRNRRDKGRRAVVFSLIVPRVRHGWACPGHPRLA